MGFLGFDDPPYVERLTAIFPSELDGSAVLEFLVSERARSGRRWDRDALPTVPASGGSARSLRTT